MLPIDVRPTRLDRAVADTIAETTVPAVEKSAQLLSWGADEHVLLAMSAVWWLYCLADGRHRRDSTHLLLLAGASAVLPHIAKRAFDQIRPDRVAIAPRRSVPVSGKSHDAFPSGHAVHMGALASAAMGWSPTWRWMGLGAAGVFSAARVVLLAHWVSDVAVGLVVGFGIDRLLRRVTGYEQPSSKSQ
jgi:membrane-associated phospholipid phosphatase